MFDLHPCTQSSLTDLGHNAYVRRVCCCGTVYSVCDQCPSRGALCPGCRHRAVLAQIAAGEVVYPDRAGDDGERHDTTAGGGARADLAEGEAGELVDGDAALGAPDVDHGSDQAVTLDATPTALYNPAMVGQSHHSAAALALGDTPMASPPLPVVLLLLPVDLAGLQPLLMALAPVITGNGAPTGVNNGHLPADAAGPPDLPTLPKHLRSKCELSMTPCPHGHTYRNTGLALRYFGNHTCVDCATQRKPRRTAASPTPASQEG